MWRTPECGAGGLGSRPGWAPPRCRTVGSQPRAQPGFSPSLTGSLTSISHVASPGLGSGRRADNPHSFTTVLPPWTDQKSFNPLLLQMGDWDSDKQCITLHSIRKASVLPLHQNGRAQNHGPPWASYPLTCKRWLSETPRRSERFSPQNCTLAPNRLQVKAPPLPAP